MTAALTWRDIGGDLQRRDYASYADYLAQQRRKLDRMGPDALAAHEARYEAALRPRLAAVGLARGTTVLCLGARGGAEVRAFRSLGCEAIGIDLNPGPDNPDVIVGDFHTLPTSVGPVEVVFTNALDHGYDLDQVLAEVQRVLAPGGSFLVEAVCGTGEGCAPGAYESLAWPTIDALIAVLAARGGFTCAQRTPFTVPWPGESLLLRRTEVPA